MKKKASSVILVFLCFCHVNADDTLKDFESILNEATQIATQKSINVDYMPSVITVIDSQTYLDAGIQNVGEALGMLPGIQIQMNYLGQPRTTIRGFSNPNSFISDKVKVLVDGVAINNEASGTAGFYMDFPLDLVDRIEVLRGPGSTVYGAGAIYGSVNIITKTGNKDNTSSFYWGIGSYKNATTGGNFHTSMNDFEIFTDAYYAQNEKSIFDKDILKTTDEEKEDLSVGLKVVNGGLKFLTRYKSSHYGNFYAYKGDLYPNNDRGHKDNYFLSQLSYKTDFNDYTLQTKLKYSYRESEITAYVDPTTKYTPVGFYINDHQVEQNSEVEASLKIPKFFSNDMVLGIGIRQADITTNYMYSSYQNFIDPTHTTDIFGKTSRTISYANLEDLISLDTNVDFTLGARVDHYSDIGTHFSSKVGLVYRANDKLILKLLYGSAFRAPTFTERYTNQHIFYRAGDQNLKEETVETYETEIIYKPNIYNKLSLNVYYSILSNVIDLEELDYTDVGYQNMKDRSSIGVEFEYFFNTHNQHDFYFNASYVEADYTVPADGINEPEIDQSMPDISKYMFKAMYIFNPTNALAFGTSWQYYSETTKTKLQWIVDYGDDIPTQAYNLFDETITYKFSASSQLRLTIKNIFDEEVRLPAYYNTQPGGVLREGRNYYLTYKYTF
jgi:outer membrane receptor for ferrienterochelin and colicin